MAHQHVTSDYMAHGFCFSWETPLVWLHVSSDIVTGIAYYSIPLAMFYFVAKRRDLPFYSIFIFFATFILACGTTHFFAAYTVFDPLYWEEGYVKAFTAIISLVSAVLFIPLIPKAIALPSLPKALADNQELNTQLNRRVDELRATTQTLEKANNELQLSERRFRAAFEQAAVGVAMVGIDGRWLRVNSKLCEITEYTAEELQELTFQEITHPDGLNASLGLFNEALAGSIDTYVLEKRFLKKSNEPVWISQTSSLVKDVSGKPAYFIIIVEDISVRRLAEKEKEQLIHQLQDKTTELERFIYTISHDLKSPLITISGFLGFLEKDFTSRDLDSFRSTLGRISQASERMKQLLDELLELSRIGRKISPPQTFSLKDLVRDAIEIVSGRISNSGAVVEIETALPDIRADRQRLLQVYENLIDNAVKFTSESRSPRVWIGVRGENDETVYYVRDDGAGIEPQYLEKIFELFEKLDPRSSGTGVGLAICKRIIEIHGGRFWAESDGKGCGSSFCFTLSDLKEEQIS